MATQSTNNDKTDISGELLPSYLEVSGFCGSLTGYLKGSINDWECNGEFTSYRLNNDELKGIFIGTMNAYGDIKKCEKAELPEEYLNGDYEIYFPNDSEEDDDSVDSDYYNLN
jgi:hypothetical protein